MGAPYGMSSACAKFCDNRHSGSGDIMAFVYHVTLQDHVIKALNDFTVRNPSIKALHDLIVWNP